MTEGQKPEDEKEGKEPKTEHYFEEEIADDPTRFPESKLFHLTLRQYDDMTGREFPDKDYDFIAVHDQRLVMLTYLKDSKHNWKTSEVNARQHFLAKVPKNADAVVHYEVDSSGCGAGDYAGYLVIQRGIALVPKKKSEPTAI